MYFNNLFYTLNYSTKLFNHRIISLAIIIFASSFVSAQVKPTSFIIGNELEKQNSTYDETPSSNSITDIVTIGDTIWLGSSRGLSRSTDKGATWKNYYRSEIFGEESVSALAYHSATNSIWCATAHSVERSGQNLPEGSGIHFSTDNGETWKSAAQPIDNETDTLVQYGISMIRALPVTVAIQNITYDIAFTKEHVWIVSFAGGARKVRFDSLFANTNSKWERVVIPPDYLDSINQTDTLKFSLQPVAGKFGTENNLNHRVFSLAGIDDSSICIGSAGGINLTRDNGKSWLKFKHQNQDFPISGNFVVALAYNSFDKTIWSASWKAEDLNESYAVSYSTDFGKTWRVSLESEKAHNFGSFFNQVICATDNGAFRTYDGGSSWSNTGTIFDINTKLKLNTTVFYSAAFLKNEAIWLGSVDGLVKNSEIENLWTDKWTILFATQPLSSKEDSYAFPNPFSPRNEILKIKYGTGGQSLDVSIRIYDFGMNYIRTIIQNAPRVPVHSVSGGLGNELNGVLDFWDGRDDNGSVVPNGVYFYRIDRGNLEPVYGKIVVMQ